MEIFEALLAGYLEHQIGVSEGFLSAALSESLKENLLILDNKRFLLEAGTGNAAITTHNKQVRGDSIYWLDKSHNDPFENEFFLRIDAFVKFLNQSCYAGITGYEFHYTLYEAGSFYIRHLDQFKNNPGRAFSMISYLNADWQEKDGGELMVYEPGCNRKFSPTQGKTVFFKSDELEHEVLLTNKRRLSITGWLKRG